MPDAGENPDQYGSRVLKNYRLMLILAVIIILAFSCLFWTIRSPEYVYLYGQYLYAPIEAPFCLSRIAKRVNIEPTYPSIKAYLGENIKLGMKADAVHSVFEQISPIGVNKHENLEEVIMLMCKSPLNNLIFWVRYDADGGFVSLEQENFP